MADSSEVIQMQSLHRWVCDICHRFSQHYVGGDMQEVIADCTPTLLRAIRTHDPSRGSLTNHVYVCVSRWLISQARLRCWRERMGCNAGFSEGVAWEELRNRSRFDPQDFMLNVSEPAAKAVEAVLASKSPRTAKKLQKWLAKEFGWEKKLILQVFAEIREAL